MNIALWLRSFVSRIDWYAEAYTAAQIRDWKTFVYCVKQSPELVTSNDSVQTHVWWLALRSGTWPVIQAVLDAGADANRRDSIYGQGVAHKAHVPLYPGYDLLDVSALEVAWWRGRKDLHGELLSLVSSATRYRALLWSLFTNDMTWFDTLADPTSFATTFDGFTLPLAALFGGVSAEAFTRIWTATPDDLRKASLIVSTAPPGHEEGNHAYPEGDALFWARYLGREDIEALLGTAT